MTYEFPATLSLPVAAGCDDTIPVGVTARADVCRDGTCSFELDATVTADVPYDPVLRLYTRGQTIPFEAFDAMNMSQLEAAYSISRELEAIL